MACRYMITVMLFVEVCLIFLAESEPLIGKPASLVHGNSMITVDSTDGGLYNLTLIDCLSMDQDSAYPPFYPVESPLNTDSTSAWFKTYWTVQFNRLHSFVNITFQFGGVPEDLTNITLHNSKLYSSYELISYCMFDGNTANCPVESILADNITLTSKSSIFLNEIYLIVKTYIELGNVTGLDIYSFISPEKRCWLTSIRPQVELIDWCCHNLTLRLKYSDQQYNQTLPNYNSLLQLPSYFNDTICHDSTQHQSIQLSLGIVDKHQNMIYRNMSYQYSHPDNDIIEAYIRKVDATFVTIQPNEFTVQILPISDITSLDFDKLTVNCSSCPNNVQSLSCGNGCNFTLGGLDASTEYQLMVYGVWKIFSGVEIAGRAQFFNATTEPCLNVYGYNSTSIRDMQPRTSTVEVQFLYQVLTTQCSTTNFTNTLIMNSGYTTLSFTCTGITQVTCLTVVQPYTTYNVTLVTSSSIGIMNTIIDEWTSPERAPSPPQNVTYGLNSRISRTYYVLLNWAPSKYPNGIIRSYMIAYRFNEEAWRYEKLSANQMLASIDVKLKQTLYYKVQAVTVSPSLFSKVNKVYIPDDVLPVVTNFSFTQLSSQNTSKCVEFSWNFNNLTNTSDYSYNRAEITCRNESTQNNSEYRISLPISQSNYHTCELSHYYTYKCSLYVKNSYRSQLVKIIRIQSPFPTGGRVISDHKLNSTMIAVIVGVSITTIIIAVAVIVALCYRNKIKNRLYSQMSLSDESCLISETEIRESQYEMDDDWSPESSSNNSMFGEIGVIQLK